MANFTVKLSDEALNVRNKLRDEAKASLANRKKNKKAKASKQEGLYKQVAKTISMLSNPRHPGLQTHEYTSLQNPFEKRGRCLRPMRRIKHRPHIESFGATAPQNARSR